MSHLRTTKNKLQNEKAQVVSALVRRLLVLYYVQNMRDGKLSNKNGLRPIAERKKRRKEII